MPPCLISTAPAEHGADFTLRIPGACGTMTVRVPNRSGLHPAILALPIMTGVTDAVTTRNSLAVGGRERNGTVAGLSSSKLAAVEIVSGVGVAVLSQWLAHHGRRTAGKVAVIAVALIHGVASANNVRVATRGGR